MNMETGTDAGRQLAASVRDGRDFILSLPNGEPEAALEYTARQHEHLRICLLPK